MKQIIIAVLTTILLSSCNGSGEGPVTTSTPTAAATAAATPSSESEWAAKVIKASSPDKVAAYDVGRGGRETPNKGQQWVSLTVEVTPPERKVTEIPQFNVKVMPGDVVFNDVRVVGRAKNAYQVVAIECPKKNSSSASPTFLFLESLKKPESLFYYGGKERWNQFRDEVHGNRLAGFVFADDANDWVVYVWDIGMLRFKPKKTSTVFLLFETPITSEQLSFQIGDSGLIPIRLTK